MEDVVLYSTGCPKCDVLKKKLDTKNITYRENRSVDDMLRIGISEVPVLEVNGNRMSFKEAVVWVNAQ